MTGQYTDFFFPEHGVRYVAVNDSYDSDKDDNDIAPFKDILNEMYAKDISKKVRSVLATSAKQGKFMGSKPPFGYIKSSENKHQLVIDPTAAEIVKRLFREFQHHAKTVITDERKLLDKLLSYSGMERQN